jgi:hypothetical protein
MDSNISDVRGALVLQHQYRNDKILKLDVSGLQAGVYIVKAVSEKGVRSAKMVK